MDYVGLLVELLYIIFIIMVSTILLNKKKISFEVSRKFIHIGLCNTYLIAWIFFENVVLASILPLLFIIINFYSYKHKTIKAIERVNGDGLGTVWYVLSIFILIVTLFSTRKYIYIGAISVLILGYADGLCGIIGTNMGKHRFKNNKSLEGSLVFFIVSYFISYLMLKINCYDNLIIYSFIIATYGTVIEVLCTKGFDNLFVPLLLAIVIYFLTVSNWFFDFSIAISINLLIGVLANGLSFFDLKGTIAAVVLGFFVYYLAGVYSYISLIGYIVFANSVSLFCSSKVRMKTQEKRGIEQVICNGLIPFCAVILYFYLKTDICLVLYLLGLAGSCSDTFGGDFGKLSNAKVRYLISGKEVPKGSSGGVTIRGLIGSLIASMVIGAFSFVVFEERQLLYFVLVSVFGFLSSVIDSIMGEVLQVKYKNIHNNGVVEKLEKEEINNYTKVSGINFIGNSMVNFLSVLASCLMLMVLYFFI